MERIKVVFGVNDFLVGGMQRQLTEQLKYYDTTRFSIQVITLFDFPRQQTLYADIPSEFTVHRLSFKGWWDVGSWVRVCVLLRRLSPDIVVSSLFFSNTVFRLLQPFFGYVSIAREHNTYSDKSKLQQAIDRILSRLSYRIVAVSTTVADFTSKQERIPRGLFEVIHNGVDTSAARTRLAALPSVEEIKHSLGFASAEKVLVSVSRLMPQKNLPFLIKSFSRFRTTHPEYSLAIVSDGPLRASLEKQVEELDETKSVLFFGYQENVWPFYKIGDALVSTSHMEGLSNAMLEALASGVPLVATRTAGTDELLQNGVNGYFISGDSEESVVGVLEQFDSLGRGKFTEAALATAERFSIGETVRLYESLFERSVTKS